MAVEVFVDPRTGLPLLGGAIILDPVSGLPIHVLGSGASFDISALPASTTTGIADFLPILQGGVQKKATLAQIKALIAAAFYVTGGGASSGLSTQPKTVLVAATSLTDLILDGAAGSVTLYTEAGVMIGTPFSQATAGVSTPANVTGLTLAANSRIYGIVRSAGSLTLMGNLS